MPDFKWIGSGVSEPQVAENDHLPLTWHIALTTVYALTCYTVITAVWYKWYIKCSFLTAMHHKKNYQFKNVHKGNPWDSHLWISSSNVVHMQNRDRTLGYFKTPCKYQRAIILMRWIQLWFSFNSTLIICLSFEVKLQSKSTHRLAAF